LAIVMSWSTGAVATGKITLTSEPPSSSVTATSALMRGSSLAQASAASSNEDGRTPMINGLSK
jgi:hypothetical protein